MSIERDEFEMSPRSKEQNEEIRKQRTQEILQAAVQVYVKKGYAASEIGEIAEQAGLARGLVYYYFGDKQTLFRELYQYLLQGSTGFPTIQFEQAGSVFDLFSEYAQLVSERVLLDSEISPLYMRLIQDLRYPYTSEDFPSVWWLEITLQPMARVIGRGMSEGMIPLGDASLMARQFWAALSEGLIYLSHRHQELIEQRTSSLELQEQLNPLMDQVIASALEIIRNK